MKKLYLPLLLLILSQITVAQTPTLKWAIQTGGPDADEAYSITTDANGNVYTTGYFRGTVDFDPGAGTFYLKSSLLMDIYIQKLDSSGNFLWAKQMGGKANDFGSSISTDDKGNIYTIGWFGGTIDFDPGAGITNLVSSGHSDIFIQKLDSAGNLLWVKQMGGNGIDYGLSISIDAKGNIYTTGDFTDTVDFNPGVGYDYLISSGEDDIFIQKLDSSGKFLWVKQMGGASYDRGYSITTDVGSNVYTTGYFSGTTDFDPGVGTVNLTAAGQYDVFIQKLDSAGNFLWARKFGGNAADIGLSVITDIHGNVYMTGSFNDTINLVHGSVNINLASAGGKDIFIQKLDPAGNFLWIKHMGGSSHDGGCSITTDNKGNIYTTGYFSGTTDFDPGAGTVNLTAVGTYDIYVQKLDSTGSYIWAIQMAGSQWDRGRSLTIDIKGNIYTTGYFSGTADFDPGVGISNLTSEGNRDIFIQKISQYISTIGIIENYFGDEFNFYPNPTSGIVTIELGKTYQEIGMTVRNTLGQVVLTKTYKSPNQLNFEIKGSSGVYFVEIWTTEGNSAIMKIVKE